MCSARVLNVSVSVCAVCVSVYVERMGVVSASVGVCVVYASVYMHIYVCARIHEYYIVIFN